MPTALLVTNRHPGEPAGRAEKIASRVRLLSERGWNVELSYVGEPYVLRFPLAVVRALRLVRSVDPDAIVTMNNPFHMHLVGYVVKTLTGLPWLAEFRDPLVAHPDSTGDSLWRSIPARVERLTVKNADLVCWFEHIQLADDYFRRTYPDLPAERFVKLPPTGFDPTRFDGVTPATHPRFTITYAGSFYEDWLEPYGFIEGFAKFANEIPDAERDRVRARFFGDWSEAYDDAAREAGVADLIETYGFVPHETLVPELMGSDALLYVGGTDPENRLSIPSKMWDYLAARTPIIGLVDPDFAAARWIRDNDVGTIAHPDDPVAVSEAIESVYSGEFRYDPDPDVFEEYSRERNADEYAALLDRVIEIQGRSR